MWNESLFSTTVEFLSLLEPQERFYELPLKTTKDDQFICQPMIFREDDNKEEGKLYMFGGNVGSRISNRESKLHEILIEWDDNQKPVSVTVKESEIKVTFRGGCKFMQTLNNKYYVKES